MKILSASQLADLDSYSCEEQNISSWELMERAAGLAYDDIKTRLNSFSQQIKVLAGPGNNGGDGLAIAYFLAEDGYDVDVFLVNFTSSRSQDNQKNLVRLKNQAKCNIRELTEDSELPGIISEDLVIDAIFGVGLNRPMPDFVQKLARHLNESFSQIICIDVPSGMYLDRSPGEEEEVFQSDVILTFQTPKLPFYLPDYSGVVGEVKIIDIGLSQKRLSEISSELNLVDLSLAKKLYQPRSRFSHKGTYGHALLIGGSQLMLGSVILSSKSCMHSGVGKTSVLMPSRGHSALIQHLPEAMLVENTSEDFISEQELGFKADAIGIGIGIGTSEAALTALAAWLEKADCPLVIDADALNLIAEHTELQYKVPKKSIITPHPGELQRLVGSWKDDFEKLNLIKDFSKQFDVIVLAKDAYSLCVYQDQVFVNSTGNSGMATAGSGDVLTGLLTGLLAQGYSSLNAAVLGMFLHGLAGDFAAKEMSEESLTASDIISYFGDSFSKLKA
ncbi:NAD(P)H-hydrate dehydratase [Psychroflexus sediminis]|uniref:Bifunctional NAD(P)H-hydrate repair enzyme n=1 Tax=Psychroflexus sediminis TaxID=470826 RepID=A0A1G7XGC6_9FLAO|nr:NAD(P)H-hydrate dehydratase [Psychroflexus sediminis]SDG83164.1 yjeF C-terminal region, hydroxyethylthiazole kinase-related/yjeF N-terminal region [Psychroflexus sediminis]